LNIPLTGTGVTAGTLTSNPTSLSFGNVQIGDTIVLRYTEALGMSMIKQ
jgi:hypothetical protein